MDDLVSVEAAAGRRIGPMTAAEGMIRPRTATVSDVRHARGPAVDRPRFGYGSVVTAAHRNGDK